MQASEQQPEQQKIIPLYMTPAAAGYASPAFGDDYEDYAVAADSEADFAVRSTGDSMEPYSHDDSIVLVIRGIVDLFSLNRARKDADVTISASSGITICCFGKVLLKGKIPLPQD